MNRIEGNVIEILNDDDDDATIIHVLVPYDDKAT